MVKPYTRYVCEVCGLDYKSEQAASICESSANPDPMAKPGDTVMLRNRDGKTYTVTKVEQLYLGNEFALMGFDPEETLLRDPARAMPVHTWVARVNPPVFLDHKWEGYAGEVILSHYLVQDPSGMGRRDNWGNP